jgi:multiple sugar transport system permease protein
MRARLRAGTLGRYAGLAVLSLVFLFPAYWMLSTAFKPDVDATAIPIQWWPQNPTLENFAAVLADPQGDIVRWTVNSLIVSMGASVAHVVVCVLAAYAFARLQFRGRDLWFWIVLGSMMLPQIVLLIPRYVLMLDLGWIDTYNSQLWVNVASAFGVFMLRQFFLTLPRELEEAARIDGANVLRVIRHVILPSSVPAIMTLWIFTYLGTWNDYIWPLFTLHGDMQTLPVGLSKFQNVFVTQYGKLMAASTIAAVPALIGFGIAQRYIVQGVTLSGLKD